MALLVVDPDEESAQALSEHLSGQGFTVVCARPGSEAVQLAANGPDLVLCAIHGEEHPISAALMLHQQVPEAPLVVVSRNGIDKTGVIEALRLGAIDVVQLDEEGEDLAATLNAAIERSARRRSGVDADGAPKSNCASCSAISAPATTSKWACCRPARWPLIGIGCGTKSSRR